MFNPLYLPRQKLCPRVMEDRRPQKSCDEAIGSLVRQDYETAVAHSTEALLAMGPRALDPSTAFLRKRALLYRIAARLQLVRLHVSLIVLLKCLCNLCGITFFFYTFTFLWRLLRCKWQSSDWRSGHTANQTFTSQTFMYCFVTVV